MSQMGYQALAPNFMAAPPESVAMFFKRDKFELEETKTFLVNELAARMLKPGEFPNCPEVVLLAALRHKISDNLLVIGEKNLISWCLTCLPDLLFPSGWPVSGIQIVRAMKKLPLKKYGIEERRGRHLFCVFAIM